PAAGSAEPGARKRRPGGWLRSPGARRVHQRQPDRQSKAPAAPPPRTRRSSPATSARTSREEMAWVQARSSDGENTGKRDNAQSNAARPAVSGNHDLTRERGRHFGHPRPRTPRSESESSDRLTLIPARQPMGSVCLTGLAAPHISVGNEVTKGRADAQLYCSSARNRAKAHRRGWLGHLRTWPVRKGPSRPFLIFCIADGWS